MALDPITTGIAKSAATAAIKPTIGLLRRQIARRGAPYTDLTLAGGADKELEEALSVLRGDADGLPASLADKLKGWLSDRPDTFADADARRFISDTRVAALAKEGARRVVRGESFDKQRAQARELHAEIVGGDGIFGETTIEDAIAFAAMTLLAHLQPADRQIMEMLADVRDELRSGVAEVLASVKTQTASPTGSPVEAEPFDDVVRKGVLSLRRRRTLPLPSLPDEGVAFGERVRTGLRLAAPAVRGEAFREVAALLIRAERIPEAQPWLSEAEAVGADTTCERARIATAEDRSDEAMRLLRDRGDALSKGLLLDAIAQRDGDDAALKHLDDNLRGEELTGHALQAAYSRLMRADRYDDGALLVEGAIVAQIDENPVLLYIRARHRLAKAAAPDVGRRLLEQEGMLPRRGDIRDDAEGRRLLDGARSDLERLGPMLPDLGADGLAAIADMNLLVVRLSSADEAEAELARADLAARIGDPAEAMALAPIARMYGVEVDWTPLKSALAEAERLGGLDDDQVRAAFAIALDESEAGELADFVHRHRDRLEPFSSNGSVVAIEIEALSKAGRPDEAKALLAAERATLGEETAAFLETTFAEVDGVDTVEARLDLYERSRSTHDLEILAATMRRHGDDRLGTHLAELWRARRRTSDARRACDAFIAAGQEREAEAFLDELGEEARTDPGLRTHLAWARYRQGRLAEAEAELSALNAKGAGDANTRHLTVLILVETGRWSELESHVRSELAARASRSAEELLAAARLAGFVGSEATFDLLRAAVAKNLDHGGIAVNAYHVATQAGLERSPEVGVWLATAIADPQRSGLVRSTGLDQVISMISESRAEADRIGDLLNTAAVPLFMGIGAAGGTQSDLVIRQMARNEVETDARRRSVVPLFAGNRPLRDDARPRSISFDPLAILVLDHLGLLDTAIDAFEDVVLPSGTLNVFFEDLGKSAHSQPTRVAQAKRVRDAVSSGQLVVDDTAVPSETGGTDPEFAALHAAAVARDGYVIDTAPLHPPGRLDATVDPAPFADRLLSPAGLVASLRSTGAISQARANAAAASVAGSGQPFEGEPIPRRGRPLLLSNLAVEYLVDARLMPDLTAFAGELRTTPLTVELADREIASGAVADEVRSGIERVRATLARAIAAGRVRLGPTRRAQDEPARDARRAERVARMSPVVSVLRDSAGVDAFVCDDRAMNKHLNTTDRSGHQVAFLTTADLLGILLGLGAIDEQTANQARETLRRSGAGMVPVDPEEMRRAARTADWSVGANAELRAIRESIHLPIARRVLQLPAEFHWLRAVSIAIAYAIRNAWVEIEDERHAERAADYLIEMLPDPTAPGTAEEWPERKDWIAEVTRTTVWAIASVFDLPASRVERYRRWFEAKVEPLATARDPEAIPAVAAALYSSMTGPLDEEDDDGGG